eukprot:363017-Chlamydomonas_euryale.AAC.11
MRAARGQSAFVSFSDRLADSRRKGGGGNIPHMCALFTLAEREFVQSACQQTRARASAPCGSARVRDRRSAGGRQRRPRRRCPEGGSVAAAAATAASVHLHNPVDRPGRSGNAPWGQFRRRPDPLHWMTHLTGIRGCPTASGAERTRRPATLQSDRTIMRLTVTATPATRPQPGQCHS